MRCGICEAEEAELVVVFNVVGVTSDVAMPCCGWCAPDADDDDIKTVMPIHRMKETVKP